MRTRCVPGRGGWGRVGTSQARLTRVTRHTHTRVHLSFHTCASSCTRTQASGHVGTRTQQSIYLPNPPPVTMQDNKGQRWYVTFPYIPGQQRAGHLRISRRTGTEVRSRAFQSADTRQFSPRKFTAAKRKREPSSRFLLSARFFLSFSLSFSVCIRLVGSNDPENEIPERTV